MQLERFIDREPKQFAYFHRLMGYSILSLILVIYAFTSPNTNYQIYVPPFFLFLLFISSKLEHWLQYQFDKKTQKSIQTSMFNELNKEEQLITNCLENTQKHIDVISHQTGLTQSELASNLLNLEFEGLVKSLPGKIYTLT